LRQPIGVFDSGLGGLSVAAQVLRTLPNERIIYFADNAHVPYGERPLEQIRGFAVGITAFLVEKGCKAVVMACNMSSAAALEAARERFEDLLILGVIEPGAKAAVNACNGKPIGVLATTGTVKSEAYVRELKRQDVLRQAQDVLRQAQDVLRQAQDVNRPALDEGCRVYQQACPRFVPLVESGLAESEEAEAAARTYVGPLIDMGCRTLILGCTHYPFLRRAIESAAGSGVTIVDPAEETVRTLWNMLFEDGTLSDSLDSPHEFYASGETDSFARLGGAFLGRSIEAVGCEPSAVGLQ